MAKKEAKKDVKKESKKSQASEDKIIRKMNRQYEKTTAQVEKMMGEAMKQFDSLQAQIQEPIRKMISDLDQMRDREMKRFNEELDRRLKELHELQESLMDRIGGVTGKTRKNAEKTVEKAGETLKDAESQVKKGQTQARKKAAEAKPASKKAPAAPKKAATAKESSGAAGAAVDRSDLKKVKGIGPATERKLKNAGITSIDQIANPSAEDREKLKAFTSVKNFDTWSEEARKLV